MNNVCFLLNLVPVCIVFIITFCRWLFQRLHRGVTFIHSFFTHPDCGAFIQPLRFLLKLFNCRALHLSVRDYISWICQAALLRRGLLHKVMCDSFTWFSPSLCTCLVQWVPMILGLNEIPLHF